MLGVNSLKFLSLYSSVSITFCLTALHYYILIAQPSYLPASLKQGSSCC